MRKTQLPIWCGQQFGSNAYDVAATRKCPRFVPDAPSLQSCLHAIGIAIQPGEAESLTMVRIAEFAQQAADGSLAAFVLGIPSSSLMLYALAQGIRYLEGPAIRSALADPRHAFVQSLEHVYTSRKINAVAG